MPREPGRPRLTDTDLHDVRRLLTGPGKRLLLWERRGRWQVRYRWAVTPVILLAVLITRTLGFEYRLAPILVVAAGIAVYNGLFSWVFRAYRERLSGNRSLDVRVSVFQAALDYVAMFLLIYFTGGAWSPLVLFLIFHVVIAAVMFDRSVAFGFAAWAAGGMWLLLAGQTSGLLPTHVIRLRGEVLFGAGTAGNAVVLQLLFTATVFSTVVMIGQIMRALRTRVGQLATTTEELAELNRKLNGLYAIVGTIGAERRLQPILDTITSKLVEVLEVPAVAIKLLDEDGNSLRYVASTGLPPAITDRVVSIQASPLNQQLLAGDSLVHGRVDDEGRAQLHAELTKLGIAAAALAPLRVEDRVIGTMGIYSEREGHFSRRDAEFLELAAELVAIALEDARANEAVEQLMHERTRFMLEVAHNLRAPLSASLSMLSLLQQGYLGEVGEKQADFLDRVEKRLTGLNDMIGELLAIARARDRTREITDVVVDLGVLALRARHTFSGEAERRGLTFNVVAEPELPPVESGGDLLEKIVENLVSNALKYTPRGGEVTLSFSRYGDDEVRIEVRDTGIGIPAAEQDQLFQEFFRASNARETTAAGTGLGLTLVRRSVERHGGRLALASEEGHGTTVVIHLPVRQPARARR